MRRAKTRGRVGSSGSPVYAKVEGPPTNAHFSLPSRSFIDCLISCHRHWGCDPMASWIALRMVSGCSVAHLASCLAEESGVGRGETFIPVLSSVSWVFPSIAAERELFVLSTPASFLRVEVDRIRSTSKGGGRAQDVRVRWTGLLASVSFLLPPIPFGPLFVLFDPAAMSPGSSPSLFSVSHWGTSGGEEGRFLFFLSLFPFPLPLPF
mmetsp:Transcript_21051/g.54474  ORF Transcript_21051/g.54474 Transcript_21051/m.54474 type:complete len:208 (-) Transcript_21051:6252-6875(-)